MNETIRERREHERQLETELRIRKIQIRGVEHLMEYKLDPFGPEFQKAGKKLQQLRQEQFQAGVEKDRYHRETLALEDAARRSIYTENQLEDIAAEAEEAGRDAEDED